MSAETAEPVAPPDRRVVLAILCLALLLRLAHLAAVYQTPFMTYHKAFVDSDMDLFDQWAVKIVQGDPLGRVVYHPLAQWQLSIAPSTDWERWYGATPIFYKAPFYAYLVALLYELFGSPMLPLALLQILASTVCVLLVIRIGTVLFGPRAAVLAGALYACYGPAIHFDVVMLRGPWIVLAALAGTWQTMRLREAPTSSRALVLGLVLGAGILANEGFAMVPPLVLLLIGLWLRDVARFLRLAGMVAIGLALALSPVVVRNLLVGAPAMTLAVTGGTVYAVFNSAGSNPYFFDTTRAWSFIPAIREGDGRLANTMWACLKSFAGPVDVVLFYARKAIGLVIPFENPDNANFYYAALRSPILRALPGYQLLLPLAVAGAALSFRRLRAILPLAPFAAALLFSIMITLPLSRYRATFAVFLAFLAGHALESLRALLAERRWRAAATLVASVLAMMVAAASLQARVVFGGRPSGIYLYRPPEFLLGAQGHEKAGEFGAALGEVVDLLRLNPDRGVRGSAMVMAARLQVEKGDARAARDTLALAAQTSAGDAGLLMAIGDVFYALLRDDGAAVQAYERALALQPEANLQSALRERLARLGRVR